MLVVALCASCAGKKQVAQATTNAFGMDLDMPCAEYGMDNDDYFRATGTGTNLSLENARLAALENAQAMVNRKLGGYVQGLSTDYSRNVRGDNAKASKVQSIIEGEFARLVEEKLDHAQQTCDKLKILPDGNFIAFISIQIPKKELLDDLTNALSENEELEIEFNRNEFRKFAEEKMAKMKEAQK